jgi:hypothetical protein
MAARVLTAEIKLSAWGWQLRGLLPLLQAAAPKQSISAARYYSTAVLHPVSHSQASPAATLTA